MGQLDQVAAGADTAVARHNGGDAPVEQLCQACDDFGMNARAGLSEGLDAGQHGRAHAHLGKRFSGSCGMAAYDVVLESAEVLVVYSVLGHWAEPGVDAVNYLVGGELRQKAVALLYFAEHPFLRNDLLLPEEDASDFVQTQCVPDLYHDTVLLG